MLMGVGARRRGGSCACAPREVGAGELSAGAWSGGEGCGGVLGAASGAGGVGVGGGGDAGRAVTSGELRLVRNSIIVLNCWALASRSLVAVATAAARSSVALVARSSSIFSLVLASLCICVSREVNLLSIVQRTSLLLFSTVVVRASIAVCCAVIVRCMVSIRSSMAVCFSRSACNCWRCFSRNWSAAACCAGVGICIAGGTYLGAAGGICVLGG